MGGLFKSPPVPTFPKPKPVRMPVQDDPNIEAARKRRMAEFRNRRGRQSTIMTSGTTSASSGQKLGT